uniref:Reverse transcriptase domain-containing protein n=1 Tax=Sphenodon punctatus TaxID=8508 RepID=A0A8D0H8V9_SPHPU
MVWDAMKAVIRGSYIAAAAHKWKEKNREVKELQLKLSALQEIQKKRPKKSRGKKITEIRGLIETMNSEKIITKLRYTKQFYFSKANKADKTLAWLVKKKRDRNYISHIRDRTGTLNLTEKDMRQRFLQFYTALYQSTNPSEEHIENFLKGIRLPQLTKTQKEYLNAPITLEETQAIIKEFPNNKATGPDGFPFEFYKIYSGEVTPGLVEAFKYLTKEGKLPPTFYEANIVLCHKSGKSKEDCSGYRPISLLNADSKIFTKILANRLQACIKDLISPDQTGFINNRMGIDNIRKVINVMYKIQQDKAPAAVISLDADKAFDRLEYNFLTKTMEKMGFQGNFINWVKLIQKDPTSRIIVNGILTEKFSLMRGTRQGCPLSPLLFNIGLEPLAQAIKQNPKITGVEVGPQQWKISLYADDTMLFLTNLKQSIPETVTLLERFGSVSGYKVNVSKSQMFLLQDKDMSKAERDRVTPFQINNLTIKYLGIYLPKNIADLYKYNYVPLIERMSNLGSSWKGIGCTWMGKINLIKMILIPKLLYTLIALPIQIPENFFTKVNRIINTIIWNKSKPRIRRSTMQTPKELGGLNLPNVKYYYWASAMRGVKLWYEEGRDPSWVTLEKQIIAPNTFKNLLTEETPRNEPVKKSRLHPFIGTALDIWRRCKYKLEIAQGKFPYKRIQCEALSLNKKEKDTLDRWSKKGLWQVKHFFIGDDIIAQDTLQDKCEEPIDGWLYLKIRSYLSHPTNKTHFTRAPYPLETELFNFTPHRKVISRLYRCIRKIFQFPDAGYIEKWEEDLNMAFTKETMAQIWSHTQNCAKSLMVKEPQIKLVFRFYLTPLSIHRANRNYSELCWRGCGHVGSYLHHWWDCETIVG